MSCEMAELPVNILFIGDAAQLYGDFGPANATSQSAGFDLCAAFPLDSATGSGSPDLEFTVLPGERLLVPTGIAIEPLESGIAGFVYSRSGLGAAKGLTVAQGVGIIDPDYRGEILVYLLNTSSRPITLRRGDRIAQLVFQYFFRPHWRRCERLGDTERGTGGFGHTGQ
ncbi:dUTP diphosphatase [Desulfovibrio sp. OttesenSCG-928-I05]|nr:dUTP diphosphatase [Desulfovibrio sp. OttesenSCG-928-I05]